MSTVPNELKVGDSAPDFTLKTVDGTATITRSTFHPDRPLVCRLYPLGRMIDSEGREWFADLPPHPETAGLYGVTGTVGSYLESQGVAPYFVFGERYAALFRRMVALFATVERDPGEENGKREIALEDAQGPPGLLLSPWLDVDATVAAYCGERGLAVPSDKDAVVELHIQAIGAWLAQLEANARGPQPPLGS